MLYAVKEYILNALISICPFMVQYLFIERTMRSVKASDHRAKARKVLLTEKEGGIRGWRRYRPSTIIRTVRMDLLDLQTTYKQEIEEAESNGCNLRAYYTAQSWGDPYVGQLRPRTRKVQLREGEPYKLDLRGIDHPWYHRVQERPRE